MAVYKTRAFSRWARKEGLHDTNLCRAVTEMKSGLFDADLGGHLLKKRIARPGQGKSAGFRTLVATNRGERWFFLYGFAKNDRGNIEIDEEMALKSWAKTLLEMPPLALQRSLTAHELTEVDCDG